MPFSFNPYKFDLIVMRKTTPKGCMVLSIYVDDFILTDSDEVDISITKAYLETHFLTHDL